MSKSIQARRWCFTSFESEVPFGDLPGDFNYVVFQPEVCPESGKEHWQGFCICKKPLRLGGIKRITSDKWHFEPARGSNQQCKDYCTKSESRREGATPTELGVFCEERSNKRKILERYSEDPEEMRLAEPSVYRRCVARELNIKSANAGLPTMDRAWQIELWKILESEPDDRTIIWVYGPKGAEGKSKAAAKLWQEGFFYTEGGTADNVIYQYAEHNGNIVFDIPRDKESYLQYSLIERVKNRMYCSNKYEPISIKDIGNNIHVVVMANFLPCCPGYCKETNKPIYCKATGKKLDGEFHKCKLSEDRIKIIYC